MNLIVRPAPNCLILDTDSIPTAAALDIAWNIAGARALGRYIEDLTLEELAADTARGFGLLLIGHAHDPNVWMPTAELGAQDAARHLAKLKALGIPEGASMVLDCETPAPTSKTPDRLAWIDAWAAPIANEMFTASVYMGTGMGLTSAEWQARPRVTRYGKSCSRVLDFNGAPVEPPRGYSWVQQQPPNLVIGPCRWDAGGLGADYEGGRMMLVYDAAHAPS